MEEGHRRCLQGGDNLWQIADAFSQSRWVQISGRQLIFAYGDTRISSFLYKVKHDNVMLTESCWCLWIMDYICHSNLFTDDTTPYKPVHLGGYQSTIHQNNPLNSSQSITKFGREHKMYQLACIRHFTFSKVEGLSPNSSRDLSILRLT
jgi:hypothetical protein